MNAGDAARARGGMRCTGRDTEQPSPCAAGSSELLRYLFCDADLTRSGIFIQLP